ncbi:YgfZ/GcvT domain-containing protein [Roseibacillus persicicus]|uniref:CAF17-like 4Fe-4S cluster assembly/insertion protein YgfZ n=1 Tax=Roseibacillus persicicus TaxID=454148 RepID=UPI00280E0958|nr:hypothetical protein [Roseibacillus persicicus]MDQ8189495.1 hypothetical protein [Roseibacillus persicicus]
MSTSFILTQLTHLRFRGPDAERYLSGQITQQVSDLPLDCSRYTFVCDAKGRILFDAHVRRDEQGFLLSVCGGDKDEIFARMDRYLIADDCELSDESDEWVVQHTLLDGKEECAVNRFGSWGRDEYQRGEERKDMIGSDPDQLEILRISNGVARIPDLAGALPAETGLEDEAISFHKGCYLGQEVISRMKRAGRTNRKLVSFFLEQPAEKLPLSFYAEPQKKALLEVTSATTEGLDGKFPALGYLSSRYEPGTLLQSSAGNSVTGLS